MKLRGAMRRLYPVEAIMNLGAIPLLHQPSMSVNSQAMERLIHHPKVKWGGDLPS
jgi:hypothetical protein